MIGQVIADRYELEELVGTGGMSSVFRAHDTLLERRVALKLLHDHVARDDDQVERFKREARSVAQLSHPNIVTVIDRGDRDGRQYIVFEYVDGENLKQLVSRSGPLPVRDALEAALQIAEALGFAHRQGLVHRDVKPQNVLLPAGGDVKVTDFGIARSIDVEGLTQTGSVVGTSHYIAPEQASGSDVDARTDVYSLGAVLYELLVGEVPFPGDSFVAVALRHVNEPPPSVSGRRPEVSPRLDAAVGRAMAKDPAVRFQSMEELGAELEACLAELGSDPEHEATMVVPAGRAAPAQPDPRPTAHVSRRMRGVAIVLALLAALVAGVVFALVYFGVPDLPGGGSGTTRAGGGPEPPSLKPVSVRAVAANDPAGDGENDGQVANATDGDPATYWSTEGYNQPLSDYKEGVGLVLTTGAKGISEVKVTTDTPGFTAELRAGSSSAGPFSRISRSATVGGTHTFRIAEGTRSRYLLLWITELPKTDKYRARVNEVTARG